MRIVAGFYEVSWSMWALLIGYFSDYGLNLTEHFAYIVFTFSFNLDLGILFLPHLLNGIFFHTNELLDILLLKVHILNSFLIM
jgi:hypothetical protein